MRKCAFTGLSVRRLMSNFVCSLLGRGHCHNYYFVKTHLKIAVGRPRALIKCRIMYVWSCLPFIKSGHKHLARHSERGKKTKSRQRKRWEDNIREWTGLEFAESQRAAENKEKMEATGSEIICGAPTTLAVNGQMRCENLEKGHVEVGGGGGRKRNRSFLLAFD